MAVALGSQPSEKKCNCGLWVGRDISTGRTEEDGGVGSEGGMEG